jgi:hypothetical protein
MAERFNNYLTKKTYNTNNQKTQVIVPKAGDSITSNGVGSRTIGSISQVHSIYVTQEVNGNFINDPLSNAAYICLYIYDRTNSKEYYIANDVLVLPHSAFYIEKTITLLGQQELRLRYSNQNGSTARTLCTVCSSIDIDQD